MWNRKKSKTVARKLEILCQNIRLSVRILWLCLRAWLVAWLITLTKLLTKLFPMKTIPLKVIETEPMLSQKKSPILSERNIVRISSSFRTKVILILTHILRQRLLRRQASLPGVLLGDQLERLKHRAVKIVQMQRHVAGVTRPRGLGSDLSHNRPPVQMAARAARGARAGA